MPQPDWNVIYAALGPFGVLAAFVAFILFKTGFLSRPEQPPHDAGVYKKLDEQTKELKDEIRSMRRDNEVEFRGIRDRMTKVEVIVEERRGRS